MWSICKKELRQFFSSLTGYIAIIVFLLINGLVLFVFRNNILENGSATLDDFFSFSPWILLFLLSSITMRCFFDDFILCIFEIILYSISNKCKIISGNYLVSILVCIVS